MAVLTLNGWSCDVAPQPTAEFDDIGERARAEDGTFRHTRVAIKDNWIFATPLVTPDEGKALRGLLSGRGDRWRFEGAFPTNGDTIGTGTNSPLWSVKGAYPTGSPVVRERCNPSGATTDTISATTVTDPYSGSSCLALEQATTNRLTQNVRTGTDSSNATTGFEASVNGPSGGAATLSASATQSWQSTGAVAQALKVVTTAVINQGARTTVISVTGTSASASVYVFLATAGATLNVYLYNNSASTKGTVRQVHASSYLNTWVRVEVTHTGTTGDNYCLCVENAAASVITYYLDALQLEFLDFSTTWVGSAAGATAAASACDLRLLLGEQKANDDLTVMFRARQPIRNSAGTIDANAPFLFSIANALSGIERLDCWVTSAGAASGTLKAAWITGNAVQQTVTLPGFTNAGGWHHVAVIMRRVPQTGGFGLEVYYDGATAGSGQSATAATPQLGAVPTLFLGQNSGAGGSQTWNGLVDEFVVLPFAAQADMIAAWATRLYSSPPEISTGGDFVADAANEITTIPEVVGTSYEMGYVAGNFHPRMTKIAFKLHEK